MKKSILLFLAFILIACLPSSEGATPAPQVTVTSQSASPTTEATATPEPTATLTPEPREFTPAETIEFTETLSGYELELAKDADLKAIYWDIAVSHLMDTQSTSEEMKFNRAIYQEIIKDHPEWEGISHSANYVVKLAYIKEFLTRSGGLMMVQNHVYEKFEVDFNKPPSFKIEEVNTLSTKVIFPIGLGLPGNLLGRGGGGYMSVDENKQLVYKLEIVPGALDEALYNKSYFYAAWNWKAGGIVSRLFSIIIAQTSYKNMDSSLHNYSLYTKGGVPGSGNFYKDVNWTFIKNK